jgi:hypothetical protein
MPSSTDAKNQPDRRGESQRAENRRGAEILGAPGELVDVAADAASTTVSIAELKSSTTITCSQLPINSARSRLVRPSQSASGMATSEKHIS